jgi:hypothetical protein
VTDLSYSHFSRMSKSDTVVPVVTNPGSSTLGDEVDLTFSMGIVKGFEAQIGGGVLFPGSAYAAGSPDAYLAFVTGQIYL